MQLWKEEEKGERYGWMCCMDIEKGNVWEPTDSGQEDRLNLGVWMDGTGVCRRLSVWLDGSGVRGSCMDGNVSRGRSTGLSTVSLKV